MIDINVKYNDLEFKETLEEQYIKDIELIEDTIEELIMYRNSHKATDEELEELKNLAIDQLRDQI